MPLLVLSLLFAVKRKVIDRFHISIFLLFLVGLGCTLYLLGLALALPEVVDESSLLWLKCLAKISQGILFYLWMRVLLPIGARNAAITFALAIVIFSVLNCSMLIIKPEFGFYILALMPWVSICSLFVLSKREAQREVSIEVMSLYPCRSLKQGIVFFLATVFVPMVSYTFIFSSVHSALISFQIAGGKSWGVQLGIAIGSFVGAFVLLGFVRRFWGRENIHVLFASLPTILLLSVWLSSSSEPFWVFFYIALLNIVQKAVYFLLILSPFLFMVSTQRLMPWCLGFVGYLLGGFLASIFSKLLTPDLSLAGIVIAISILFLSIILAPLYYNARVKQFGIPIKYADERPKKYYIAIQRIADEYLLTPREVDVLGLLGKGYLAKSISAKLTISHTTAKTHQKNVYAKLGVHNQQDLIMFVDAYVEKQIDEANEKVID